MEKLFRKTKKESGQALIIVVVILVVIAIIATSVAFRTISDTKRTGQERASLDSFTYAESAIEDLSNQITECKGTGKSAGDCIYQMCGDSDKCTIKCNRGDNCPLLEGFTASECNEVSVLLKSIKTLSNRSIVQDDAITLPVENQNGVSIDLTWTGAILEVEYISYSGATGYSINPTTGREYYLHNAASFSSGVVPTGTSFVLNNGTLKLLGSKFTGISYLRLRAFGNDAVVSATGFQDPIEVIYSANGFCGNVSRNQVIVEPVLPSIDGSFDYVLYSDKIVKSYQ